MKKYYYDYGFFALRMALVMAMITAGFLLYMVTAMWAMVPVLFGLAWAVGKLDIYGSDQGWGRRQPILLIDEQKLARLRELHRRGDG